MRRQQPIVSLKDGLLRGEIKFEWQGQPYYSFRGIPYGKPPIGNLRFKASQPSEPWSGVRDATKEANNSYYRNYFKNIVGFEDCLYLNVYSPELPTSQGKLKPVMVFIHGGGFITGSTTSDSLGPDFLMNQDIVLVTINYRLGLLGFASFEDASLDIPGNAGLKDQVLALKWVQNNITKFCGNPDNVTIFGQSAGGASVHYLMLSPLAAGLFHRAIAQSGVATSLWASGQRTAPLVSKALGLNTTNEQEIVKILMGLSVEDIFNLQEKIPNPSLVCKLRSFGPVVETFDNGCMFISQEPSKLIKSGNFNQVPLMVGYNSREGISLHNQFKDAWGTMVWDRDFENSVPVNLNLPRGSPTSRTIAEMIKQFYYGNTMPSLENIQPYYLLQTDTFYFFSINSTVKYQSASSCTPIYYYRLSVDTKLNIYKEYYEIKETGTSHGDELGYLFKSIVTPYICPNSLEDITLRRIIKLWTTFARYGDPNPVQKDSLINVTWLPVKDQQLHFLDIGENLTVGVNPESERARFWDDIYSICNVKSNL